MKEFFVLAQGAAQPQAAAPAATSTNATTAVPGKAAEKAPEGGAFGGLMGMLPMILIIGAMFYLMWRGQSKERKKREAMLSAIKAGDKVVTIGGIAGTIAEVKAEGYILKIAENVKVEVTKGAIGSVVPVGDAPAK